MEGYLRVTQPNQNLSLFSLPSHFDLAEGQTPAKQYSKTINTKVEVSESEVSECSRVRRLNDDCTTTLRGGGKKKGTQRNVYVGNENESTKVETQFIICRLPSSSFVFFFHGTGQKVQ